MVLKPSLRTLLVVVPVFFGLRDIFFLLALVSSTEEQNNRFTSLIAVDFEDSRPGIQCPEEIGLLSPNWGL